MTLTERIGDILWVIKDWVDAADWRSWIFHAVIGLPIGYVFGIKGVAAAYLIRELEQLAFEFMLGDLQGWQHWLDHVLDVAAPVLVAWMVYR